MEEASPDKHEYVAGEVFLVRGGDVHGLAGATERHNRIAMNVAWRLGAAAHGGPCRVYGSDMLLRIDDTTVYYPDIQVICDPTDTEQQYKTRPCLIVEVLSPSTTSIDRREKLLAYKSLESLEAYLIVWSDKRRCLLYYRAEERKWFSATYGASHDLRIPCPELRLTLDEIYDGVELENRNA